MNQRLARPIGLNLSGRGRSRSHHGFILRAMAESFVHEDRTRRRDEASQDLFIACVSFIVLLIIAVADVVFRL